ncbi:dihydropteroate synthase [Treponema phagedenis]|uniref:Dihydropteroate synthase n=2 Tax=Treponema phagedenis TaxID=162 RepID=A0AAE6ITR8_TREPH|nr:dihydropteroate synthase [Treponema phagedenis]QEJ97107.1 dihydropteroate synthase [Treponema phagedenis]QEK02703.1 dihydropteroate synthase [Treponema phagedenis]QEK08332.1 dihydropteroate synthase [Treponema phagedenis]
MQKQKRKKPLLCGIVNVTPDSFSDGGKYNSTEKAVAHALQLVEAGAEMLDIGGESTRPGSTIVPIKEEVARVVPVIRELKKRTSVPLSVDTWKSEVAQAVLEAGADIINDVTGLAGDSKMAATIAKANCRAVLMFNAVICRPAHKSARDFPQFNINNGNEAFFSDKERREMSDMPVLELAEMFLNRSIERAKAAGISLKKIALDPGIGFGLTKRENLVLLKNIAVLRNRGFKIFLGVSRKRFLMKILSKSNIPHVDDNVKNADIASAMFTAFASTKKIDIVRIHSII